MFTYEYLPTRGLTRDTLKFYDVGTKIDESGKPIEICFRYPNADCKVRLLSEKDFRWLQPNNSAKAGLFGSDKFAAGSHRYVTITEGEFDACSLYQALASSRHPVVSVQSSGSAVRDCTVGYDWLNSFERIYLAFDNDEPGREATRNVSRMFDYHKVYVLKFSNRKDANEYLQHGEEDVLRNIWSNAKHYLPEKITSSLTDFFEDLKHTPKYGVSYPFPTLTDMTYGIRTGETVLITAAEKVGKTSLMHAILYKLLKETDHAVGAFFLEEPQKRLLQSLAGLELQKPVHLPDSGCTQDQICTALEQVVKTDDRLYVYSHFGSDDPDVLIDTIRFLVSARGCRYIMLDHISMACGGSTSEIDERRALDYLMTKLQMLVKSLDFALILVSHVNDEGKTRGTRWLTKVADITINATRDTLHPDATERMSMYLTIPFNRYSCKTGPAGKIMFNPITYTYSEVVYANDNFPLQEKVA